MQTKRLFNRRIGSSPTLPVVLSTHNPTLAPIPEERETTGMIRVAALRQAQEPTKRVSGAYYSFPSPDSDCELNIRRLGIFFPIRRPESINPQEINMSIRASEVLVQLTPYTNHTKALATILGYALLNFDDQIRNNANKALNILIQRSIDPTPIFSFLGSFLINNDPCFAFERTRAAECLLKYASLGCDLRFLEGNLVKYLQDIRTSSKLYAATILDHLAQNFDLSPNTIKELEKLSKEESNAPIMDSLSCMLSNISLRHAAFEVRQPSLHNPKS